MSTCLDFTTLVALWSNELDHETAERVEQHLFSCDRCQAASDRLGYLVDGVRGVLPPVISHARVDRLVAEGTRIIKTVVNPGVDAHARFAPDVDLLVHVLRADLSRAERVDVDLLSANEMQQLSLEHVPFDVARGEVLICCQRHFEQFPFEPKFRVHVVEGGARRAVGDYTIHHVWR